MKHTLKVTLILVALFLFAQVIGLFITNQYVDIAKTAETGELSWEPLPSIGGVSIARPDVSPERSIIYILGAIVIGTLLILLIIKLGRVNIWKLWFFVAAMLCLHIAFGAFMPSTFALVLALLAAFFKVYRPNIFVHNVTELFVYGGLAVIFVPIMNMFAAIALMFLLSLYDMYAVWKSRHMVAMAKFQTKSGIFAGMLLPYEMPKFGLKKLKKAKPMKTAILGGGDIGFPLIFSGVVMKTFGFASALVMPFAVSLALLLLLLFGQKKKFYPAIPFLTAGCLVGYALVWIISLF